MGHSQFDDASRERTAWNAGKKVGTKRPLTQNQIWAVRFFLDRERRIRDRALFDLAIDSKLRGCDLVKIRIRDVVAGPEIRTRAIVVQQKTGRPVQFEITGDVRASLLAWLERRGGTVEDYAFPSRVDHALHMSTRQYARLVDEWVTAIGLRPLAGPVPTSCSAAAADRSSISRFRAISSACARSCFAPRTIRSSR